MNILIISATEFEKKEIKNKLQFCSNISYLITGVGIPATVFNLTKYLENNKPDLIINIGIAGAYNSLLDIGTLVKVERDYFADLGMEKDSGGFEDLFDTGFMKLNEQPFKEKALEGSYSGKLFFDLKKVVGATVNKVSGTKQTSSLISQKYNAGIETMEGAAVFYVALQYEIPCVQIRAVSNMAGDRDKKNWNIQKAVKSLTDCAFEQLKKL